MRFKKLSVLSLTLLLSGIFISDLALASNCLRTNQCIQGCNRAKNQCTLNNVNACQSANPQWRSTQHGAYQACLNKGCTEPFNTCENQCKQTHGFC